MSCRLLSFLVMHLFLVAGIATAEEKGDRFWHAEQDRIYGEEMLSPEERQEYRRKIWEFKTEAEREHFRDTYRQMVDERARTPGMLSVDTGPVKSEREQKKWPDDGLRRWPEAHLPKDGVRRWSGPPRDRDLAEKTGGSVSRTMEEQKAAVEQRDAVTVDDRQAAHGSRPDDSFRQNRPVRFRR